MSLPPAPITRETTALRTVQRVWVTLPDAALITGLRTEAWRRMIAAGQIPADEFMRQTPRSTKVTFEQVLMRAPPETRKALEKQRSVITAVRVHAFAQELKGEFE